MARKAFYGFHYKPDNWRASQVRNIGVIEGNAPVSDNDWESITKGGDAAIEKWIAGQLFGRSCTVVLVGEKTAWRKWITHEITESWNAGVFFHTEHPPFFPFSQLASARTDCQGQDLSMPRPIQQYCREDEHAANDELPVGGRIQQRHAVGDDADEEDAHQRAPHGPLPA